MSHVQSPLSGGAGTSRARAFLGKRTGLALLAPTLVALALGVAPTGAQAATTGSISGTLTVPAGTVHPSDVNIQLANRNGDSASNQGTLTVTDTSATTASYTIAGVSPGQYYMYFNDTATADNVAPDYYGDGGADNITKGTVVTVPATGGTQALTAETLTPGAIITGTVTDANTASETAAHVTAVPNAAASVNDPMLPNIRRAVSVGTYKISGLPADTFSLSYDATGSSFSLSNVWVDGSGLTYDYGSGSQYAVTGSNTTAVNFSVPAVGGISGTVTAASGGALPDVGVSVYDAAGNIIPVGATTAADGTYTITDVLPGSYEVQFGGLAGSNLASSFYGGSSTLGGAGKVTVSSGATTPSINGSLAVGATISGSVTAAQGGAELGGLPVEVLDAQGNVVAQTTTNPNGTYTLNDVPAGTWYVEFVGGRAYNGSYYASEYYLGMSTLGGSLPIKLTAGETLLGINEALPPESITLPGLPKVSLGKLSGLSNNKVALSFRLTAGTGPAGYLLGFTVKLPKYVSWNRAALKNDIVIPGDKYTYAIKSGRLVITFTGGKKLVNFRIKAGGVTVGKGLEALAKKHKIASEGIALTATDTTGKLSAASFTVKKPH